MGCLSQGKLPNESGISMVSPRLSCLWYVCWVEHPWQASMPWMHEWFQSIYSSIRVDCHKLACLWHLLFNTADWQEKANFPIKLSLSSFPEGWPTGNTFPVGFPPFPVCFQPTEIFQILVVFILEIKMFYLVIVAYLSWHCFASWNYTSWTKRNIRRKKCLCTNKWLSTHSCGPHIPYALFNFSHYEVQRLACVHRPFCSVLSTSSRYCFHMPGLSL